MQPRWFSSGREYFPAMLTAIARAGRSIELETYIYADDQTGRAFLQALTQAARRGVQVRVLADSYGSLTLTESFFTSLTSAGGVVKFFNPLRFQRFGVRDHRKLLICDEKIAFIGGANIADEYSGDGITQGWFDTVTQSEDRALAAQLREEFEHLFNNADFNLARRKLRPFRPLRHRENATKIFAVKPGRGASGFQRALHNRLENARMVDLITPYFLPNRRLRILLNRVVKRGGRVRLMLPAKSDVPLARVSAHVYYARLLRAGVEIYEYQPQILHAKLYRVDDTIFAGSSNLDVRSLMLNYELMLGFNDAGSQASAGEIFEAALKHSQRITWPEFRRSQTFWQRLKNRWAHFLLARIDPFIALRHIR